MRFGVCASPKLLPALIAAGFDYLEPAVTSMLQPEHPEVEVMPPLVTLFAASALKPESYNLLLPGDLKVVGPEIDVRRQARYLETAFRRAQMLGGEIAVFGSGGARQIPTGWAEREARAQMLTFLKLCGDSAQRYGMAMVIEPLNASECNNINSVAEAVALAEEVSHPAIGVLSDLYHLTHDGQSYEETRNAGIWLRHVHVAGQGRRAPIADDLEYLGGYFAMLKQADYAGHVSIEANWESVEEQAAAARQVVGRAWEEA